MLNYRGVEIKFGESQAFVENGYSVRKTDGMVFKASSKYGSSYALTSDDAIEGAKKQIDQNIR